MSMPASISRRRAGAALAMGLTGLTGLAAPARALAASTEATGGLNKFAQLRAFPFFPADGLFPVARLLWPKRNSHLYGSTMAGGEFGDGTIFRVRRRNHGDPDVTVIHSFDSSVEGGSPMSPLVEGADGAMYGTTPALPGNRGPCAGGSIYRLWRDGTVETVHAFSAVPGEPSNPRGGLVQASDGRYYGTTQEGGHLGGGGTAYVMTHSGKVKTICNFKTAQAAGAWGELIEGADGRLYGTSEVGGALSYGTVFALTTDGECTLLHDFSSGASGRFPRAGLLLARDGLLCGTTRGHGTPQHDGTVFRLAPDGSALEYLSLRQRGPLGARPLTALLQARNGALYGSTSEGGPHRGGCIFELGDDHKTRIHAFDEADGRGIGIGASALVQPNDDALYGVTRLGGYGGGTVFRIDHLEA